MRYASGTVLSLVTPHVRLESVLEFEVEHARALGLRGLLVDVDCTLKDHAASEFSSEVIAWAAKHRAAGLAMCLVSNGRARRIAPLARALGIPFVANAWKPLPFGCRTALRLLALDRHEVAIVGDQIFADTMAGRLAGVFTILVTPTSPEEPWFTRLKRPFERALLRRVGPLPIAAISPQETTR